MSINQTPIVRGSKDNGEAAYMGFAQSQMRILKDYMKMAKLNAYSRIVTLANGVVITCKKCFEREDIFISVPPLTVFTKEITKIVMRSFLYNPRILLTNDGYKTINGKLMSLGSGEIQYPFGGEDSTTQRLRIGGVSGREKDGSGVLKVEVLRDSMQYGNIDWKGINTANSNSISNALVLTWKGPQGRSIAFDYTKPISGLTSPDIVFSDTASERFTCFGPRIYRSGEVAYTAVGNGEVDTPTKVLGCAYQKDTLVCIVNNHYSGKLSFFEEVWINKGDPTLYDETKSPKGWRLLNSKLSERPTMIWAFNQSGTRATQGLYEYTIDIDSRVVSLANTTEPGISVMYDKEATETTYSGSSTVWSDYKGDERVFAVVHASGGHKFSYNHEGGATDIMASISIVGTAPTLGVYMVGNQAYVDRTGVQCECNGVWSISDGTISETGLVDTNSACGTVTVTYTCQDLTASTEVAMSSGVWVLVSDCGASSGGDVLIDQGTKTVERVDLFCGSDCLTVTYFSNVWDGVHCYADAWSHCTLNGYDTELRGTQCGYPTIPHPNQPDANACVDSGSVSYQHCDGSWDSFTVTHAPGEVLVTRRTIYKWECIV